ncbi:BZ3500_MvSof-1268-A1-R1_Chr2-3g05388 [Microbotryum saponariae]|uniref:Kynurenine 3-monooxygenase n=1 Tax=Microbotryum saponariae TaxID=289078 RepID=A0A2X0M1D1_9BASI|nr:BZ3500_MvSof-1268-A1-R1_Chr2-3g05388 [Microbotryum saponariae]SDA01338.1 BZ3501_MvSof-1269-A2-R1_Chr2-2g05061 [Microbotryum saponariae]
MEPLATSSSSSSAKSSLAADLRLDHNHRSSSESVRPKVLIAGAGLVGSLCASMLAQRGYDVLLVESRSDPRETQTPTSGVRARSINLALSPRGIEALRSVDQDLADRVIQQGLEMRGRLLHKRSEANQSRVKKEAQDYGLYSEGEVIRSISRTLLGIYLLDHIDSLQHRNDLKGTVEVRFETKLLELDLRAERGVKVKLSSKQKGEQELKVDWVVGGDGAYSRVRREMMRGAKTRFDFKQTYARHAYLELSILPGGKHNKWTMENNYLHIWPRGEFMMIALPNQDGSFTLTLFAPHSTFESLDKELDKYNSSSSSARIGPNPVVEKFRAEFPDALELMGEDELIKAWTENPKDGLVTVECSPYHYKDKALLIGDAAHAMVPFYGQGMNCAFEDVRVLSTLIDHYQAAPFPSSKSSSLPYSSNRPDFPSSNPTFTSLENALSAYTVIRTPSIGAIQTLAHRNYTEMAASVLSPIYLLRLYIDSFLSKLLRSVPLRSETIYHEGSVWESLYRMTTFRYEISYEEVLKRRAWQQRVLSCTVAGAVVSFLGVGLELARRSGALSSLGRLRWERT